jgi:lipoate-protein ligase B
VNCDTRERRLYERFPEGKAESHRIREGGKVSGGVWKALGQIPYSAGLEIQERIAEERRADLRPDTLLLLEHPPTITLGRRGSAADILWDEERLTSAGIAVERVGRGGLATYHGPGQLVGYPITKIRSGGRGVREFVAAIEETLGEVVRSFGLIAERRLGHPGVWVGPSKIASIGIEVRRGVSRHGFALNVDMDLAPFQGIVPCGTPALDLTDLSRATGERIRLAEAERAVVGAWSRRFGGLDEEASNGFEAVG